MTRCRHVQTFALVMGLVAGCVGVSADACTPHIRPINDVDTEHRVPGVVGDSEAEARVCLRKFGYGTRLGGEEPSRLPKGVVVRTSPGEGTSPIYLVARRGPTITVTYWISSGQSRVPDLRGATSQAATERLVAAGLVPGATAGRVDLGDPGLVVDQQPAAGSLVDAGTPVAMWISTPLTVPDIVGMQEDEAQAALRAVNLVGRLDREEPSARPRGEVIASEPSAGARVAEKTEVRYFITSGQNSVPDVVGMSVEEGRSILADAGFAAGIPTERPAAEAAGTILVQQPRAHTSAALGQSIDLTTSAGPLAVPNVIGTERTAAEALLKEATFLPQLVGTQPSPRPPGTVLRTSPVGGTRHAPGLSVEYWIASGHNYVPILVGLSRERARSQAEQSGFHLGEPRYRYELEASDRVLEQSPADGLLSIGAPIEVTLGSTTPPVPDLSNLTEDRATAALEEAGMTVASVSTRYRLTSSGRVLDQHPAAGTVLASGQPVPVELTISKSGWPLIAGTIAVLAVLAGLGWTQLRAAPLPPPLPVEVQARLEPSQEPPAVSDLQLNRSLDVHLAVHLDPGESSIEYPSPEA